MKAEARSTIEPRIEVIKNSIEGLDLWMDDATRGSAFTNDAWASLEPDAGAFELSLHLGRVSDQHPGRFP